MNYKNFNLSKHFVILTVCAIMLFCSIPSYASEGMGIAPKTVCGYDFNVLLKSDGTVWTCGQNGYGQLGNRTNTASTTYVQVTDSSGIPITNITGIAAGYYHALALQADGTVWAWGYNNSGQLGDSSKINRNYAQRVLNADGSFLNQVSCVSCGLFFSMALKSDGSVWGWGYNACGQLSDGTYYSKLNPVRAIDSTGRYISGVVQLSSGDTHNIALRQDGTVFAWGYNLKGNLGIGTASLRVLRAVQVPNLSQVVSVNAGGNHNMVIKSDGTAWAWGYNNCGQLGDGTITDRYSPVQMKEESGDFLRNVRMVSAGCGGEHSLILKNDGTVWICGFLGSNDPNATTAETKQTAVPVRKQDGTVLDQIIYINAGLVRSSAISADKILWSWGYNDFGELGTGTMSLYEYYPISILYFI